MTIFQIIAFILANKSAIAELIKLIQDVLASFKGDNAVALSEESVSAMAANYPALQSSLAVNGQSFMDLYRNNYWETNIEMFARTFERWVQKKLHDSGRENTYLTGLRKQGHVLWPSDKQVDAMAPHFERLMAHFRANAEKYMARFLSSNHTWYPLANVQSSKRLAVY